MPADARIQESNPFVEIATHLFLEDLAGKVGVAGLNNYLVSLAKNLATAMPREEYASWSEFLGALRDGQSTLSTFEEVRPVTERCMTSMRSPFERGWREYAKRVGTFAPVHREAAAARIRVGEEAVRYEPVASAWVDGATQLPEGAKLESLLKRAGISHTKLGMLLRNHSDVWLLEPF